MKGEGEICSAELLLFFFSFSCFPFESTALTVGQWITGGIIFLPSAGPDASVQLAFQAHGKTSSAKALGL